MDLETDDEVDDPSCQVEEETPEETPEEVQLNTPRYFVMLFFWHRFDLFLATLGDLYIFDLIEHKNSCSQLMGFLQLTKIAKFTT